MQQNASTLAPDTMFYRVRVIDNVNGCDDPVSNEIQVIIRADAQITAAINNAEVCVGGVALLTATLTGGSTLHTGNIAMAIRHQYNRPMDRYFRGNRQFLQCTD
jgi:hypothetical protein